MKLKPIPANTVVHTPIEAEAKELLAILHKNGYEWYHKNAPIPNPRLEKIAYINIYNSLNGCSNVITYCDKYTYVERYITLAEFKERYAEEEESQPKFKVGDKVRILGNCGCNVKGVIGTVERVGERGLHVETAICRLFVAFDEIEPYTEPETKPTENMGTKEKEPGEKGNNSENSQLDLSELLKGHEGDTLYSPIWGECDLQEINADNNNGSQPLINLRLRNGCTRNISASGHIDYGSKRIGIPILWPSKALYEQYPLDAKNAWMKWREEQKKFALDVNFRTYDTPDFGEVLFFHTPEDRDKCISEIKAIIEKYN